MKAEDHESMRFIAALVAMRAIIMKVPAEADSDLPRAVTAGAVDYADNLLAQLYGDDSTEG